MHLMKEKLTILLFSSQNNLTHLYYTAVVMIYMCIGCHLMQFKISVLVLWPMSLVWHHSGYTMCPPSTVHCLSLAPGSGSELIRINLSNLA